MSNVEQLGLSRVEQFCPKAHRALFMTVLTIRLLSLLGHLKAAQDLERSKPVKTMENGERSEKAWLG